MTTQNCTSTQHIKNAQKICISPQCSIQSAYICPNCQQLQEHNGSILAVRIAKVKDVLASITNKQKIKNKYIEDLLKMKQQIVNKIDQFVSSKQKQQGKSQTQSLNTKYQQLSKEKGNAGFINFWNQIKNYNQNEQNNPKKTNYQFQTQQLKKQLITIIDQKFKKQSTSTSTSTSTQPINQFIQKLSSILCNMSLQLKSAPSAPIIEQLHDLKAYNRQTKLLAAKLYQLHNQSKQAINLYDQILRQYPLDLQVVNRKALLLKKMKMFEQAYQQFGLLISLLQDKTNNGYYYFMKGEVCIELGRLQQALSQFQKCRGKAGIKQSQIDNLIASVYLKQNKQQQARKLYQKLIKSQQIKNQDRIKIHQKLLQHSFNPQIGNWQQALTSLNYLYSENPSNIEYLFKRAKVNHQLKNYEKSIEDYTQAILRADNIPGLYYNRAVEYVYLGKKQSAIVDLKKAIQLDPNFKQAVHLLGNTCFEMLYGKDRKEETLQVSQRLKQLAINCYLYTTKNNPKNEGAWHNLGILQTQKNPQKAYQYYSKALQINPKLASSLLGKIKTGIILRKDPKQSLNEVLMLIDYGDRTVPTFLIKCALQTQLMMYDKAFVTANIILQADPSNKNANQMKNSILQSLKKSQKSNALQINQNGNQIEAKIID